MTDTEIIGLITAGAIGKAIAQLLCLRTITPEVFLADAAHKEPCQKK